MYSMTRIVLIALALISLTAGGCKRPEQATTATVCELASNPTRYHKKLVTVAGVLKSDGVENTTLVDPSCRATAVAFVWGPDGYTGEMKVLGAELADLSGTVHKDIRGTFTGRFLWDRSGHPVRTLVVSDVSQLTVKHVARRPPQ